MLSDPKIRIVTMTEFMKDTDYLIRAIGQLWQYNKRPEVWRVYYHFTSKFFIKLIYDSKIINFGLSFCEQLEEIQVAYRDTLIEEKYIKKGFDKLNKLLEKNPKSEYRQNQISEYKSLIESIPPYNAEGCSAPKRFEEYLIDTGEKAETPPAEHYLVIDVETNGLRRATDDLLSLSIYDPKTGICYNRFLPLDRQPMVLTSYINGLTEEDLCDAAHITQDEMNRLVEYFDLNNAKLLSYSGGKGTFDYDFFKNYCKRHRIKGLGQPELVNIKSVLGNAGFGFAGHMTKDNLCKMLGIEGVTETHSGINDCILEWKLYKTISERKLAFLNGNLYEYSDKYIIPISYFGRYKSIDYYSGLTLPELECKTKCIFSYSFNRETVKKIRKFPTNITGISIENTLKKLLGAQEQNNYEFMAQNKRHLRKVGSLRHRLETIYVDFTDTGEFEALDEDDDSFVNEINRVNREIANNMHTVVDFIKKNIFTNETILSHEIVFSCNNRIFAECDFSSKSSVLEVKTSKVVFRLGELLPSYQTQLYYQSAGRRMYLLTVDFEFDDKKRQDLVGLTIDIYNVFISPIS